MTLATIHYTIKVPFT